MTLRLTGRRSHSSSVMRLELLRSWWKVASICLPNSDPRTTTFNSSLCRKLRQSMLLDPTVDHLRRSPPSWRGAMPPGARRSGRPPAADRNSATGRREIFPEIGVRGKVSLTSTPRPRAFTRPASADRARSTPGQVRVTRGVPQAETNVTKMAGTESSPLLAITRTGCLPAASARETSCAAPAGRPAVSPRWRETAAACRRRPDP